MALNGHLLQANPALCRLLGRSEDELLAGSLADVAHPDERAESEQLHRACIEGRPTAPLIDRRLRHASGHWLHTQLSVAVVRDDDGTPLHLIAQVVDLTARRALEAEVRAAAIQDPLTGLANRRELTTRLQEADLRRQREAGDIGLLFLDLDDFKEVNDTYGHDVGDRVLVEVGRRLVAATRDTDTVCRIGGDEFVVMCAPIDGERGLRELVARIADAPPLTAVVGDGAVEVVVQESMGAVLLAPGEQLDQVLRRADAAMYAAKRAKTAAHRAAPQPL